MSPLAALEHQWKAFKYDAPGYRFENQRERMKRNSRAFLVATTTLGAILLAGGIVLLFIPGPGLLVAIFGLALIAGVSQTLARILDRAEPVLRHWAHRAKVAWTRASNPAKVAVIAVAAALVGAAANGVYRMWFA